MKKDIYTVYSQQFYTPIVVLVFFPIFILLYSLYYNDIRFFYSFVWVIPPICLFGIALGSVRKVVINQLNKSVTIYEWFGEVVTIASDSLESAIQKDSSITHLTYKEGEKVIGYNFYSWHYSLFGAKKTIMRALQEFNPHASFEGLEKF